MKPRRGPRGGSRRILITGLSSGWGGRLAQILEDDDAVEALIGVDTRDPRHELQRTEFVRVGSDDTLLRRIVRAARIDTVVDTRLPRDGFADGTEPGEDPVTATRSMLAACGGEGSPVRRYIFRSAADYYGGAGEDPAFFSEEMNRSRPPRSEREWEIAMAEAAVAEFARDNPRTTVTVLRCATAIGSEVRSPHLTLLGLPMVPSILGFDPRWQFVHEDDVLGALAHAVRHTLPGPYNVAADGVLSLSEVVSLLGKAPLPVLPPWGTMFAALQLRRLGLPLPVELLRDLRYGRGLDNRRLKAAGYRYRYTTREAVLKLRAQQRLRPLLGAGGDPYRYEREVEEFLRWSPSVQRTLEPPAGDVHDGGDAAAEPGRQELAGQAAYEDLTEGELLQIVGSLEQQALVRLRDHERAGAARATVLQAIERQLELRRGF